MPLSAFLLVLLAAFAHSTWNLLAKRAAHSKHLIWFSSVMEAAIFLPVAAWVLATSWSTLGAKPAIFLLGTGVLHVLYTESLLRGYRAGDLSVVYPLARGTGPLLSFFGAVLILREQPSPLGIAGAMLITFGILILSGGWSALGHQAGRVGIAWGLATGCVIAGYTLVDGYSVKVLLVSPFLVEYAGNFFRMIVLTAGALCNRASLASEYRQYRVEALGIAVLTPAGYVLVLSAMTMAPVSHVAPVREMSMMIGAYFGVRFLGEGDVKRRIIGSALIVTGVAGLALG